MNPRTATVTRQTTETDLTVKLNLDGGGRTALATGIGFLDHMLTALALHAGWDLELTCRGDLPVDDHHTVEDCALALGQALDQALGDRTGLARFGWALVPLDEALARAAVDLATRPTCSCDLQLVRESLGGVACENLEHFMVSLARAGRFCLHLDLLKGSNDHHKAEAGFKSLARALRQAVQVTGGPTPSSTKGVL